MDLSLSTFIRTAPAVNIVKTALAHEAVVIVTAAFNKILSSVAK